MPTGIGQFRIQLREWDQRGCVRVVCYARARVQAGDVSADEFPPCVRDRELSGSTKQSLHNQHWLHDPSELEKARLMLEYGSIIRRKDHRR